MKDIFFFIYDTIAGAQFAVDINSIMLQKYINIFSDKGCNLYFLHDSWCTLFYQTFIVNKMKTQYNLHFLWSRFLSRFISKSSWSNSQFWLLVLGLSLFWYLGLQKFPYGKVGDLTHVWAWDYHSGVEDLALVYSQTGKPWTPEIFLECCVERKKPIGRKKLNCKQER